MATTAPDPTVLAAAATDAAPAKGGRRRKLILIGAALLLVCAAAGGAAYMKFMRPHAKPVVVVPAPVFFTLGSFTVNLAADRDSTSSGGSSSGNTTDSGDGDDDGAGSMGGDRYLHIGLTLKLKDPKTEQLLTEHMPEIRSRVLLLLSAKRPADLATVAGKRALAIELAKSIDGPFPPDNTPHPVSEVLFTDFVVQ